MRNRQLTTMQFYRLSPLHASGAIHCLRTFCSLHSLRARCPPPFSLTTLLSRKPRKRQRNLGFVLRLSTGMVATTTKSMILKSIVIALKRLPHGYHIQPMNRDMISFNTPSRKGVASVRLAYHTQHKGNVTRVLCSMVVLVSQERRQ